MIKPIIGNSSQLNFDRNSENELKISHEHSKRLIKDSNGTLPDIPPLEKHPYLVKLSSHVNNTLIIGTFPPISYLCDVLKIVKVSYGRQSFSEPITPYFHGNKDSFWQYCPIGYEQISGQKRQNRPRLISDQLDSKKIIYSDIIKYCQRELIKDKKTKELKYTPNDTCLTNVWINEDIFDHLEKNRNLENIYFTNSISFRSEGDKLFIRKTLNLKLRDSFTLFLYGLFRLDFKVFYQFNNETWERIGETMLSKESVDLANKFFSNKTHVKLRIEKDNFLREFNILSCISPAAVNRGQSRKNLCIQKFKQRDKINISNAPKNFLTNCLKNLFENNITAIKEYNI